MPVEQINPNNSGTITLGAVPGDYSCQITDWQLLPVANVSTRPGTYCAPPTDVPGLSSWTLQFSFLQDWTVDGISQFTFDNDGTLQPFSFVPDVVGAPTISGDVWVTATAYGGLPAEAWVSSGTWNVDGTPTITAPV